MASRPRHHDSGGDPPDEGGGTPRPHGPDGDPGNVAEAQAALSAGFLQWRPSMGRDTTAGPSRPQSPDDIELSLWEEQYTRLGDEPPKINMAGNDAAQRDNGAHTMDHHGPHIPLRRDSSEKTIEGRIYGDTGWPANRDGSPRPQNGSFRWSDPSTMNRTINEYVRSNWETIRNDLAVRGRHQNVFSTGHAVGEGFVNRGMFGAGPRQAQYAVTSTVRILIELVPGSDPPQPFIVTAFPTGLG